MLPSTFEFEKSFNVGLDVKGGELGREEWGAGLELDQGGEAGWVGV